MLPGNCCGTSEVFQQTSGRMMLERVKQSKRVKNAWYVSPCAP
jgi:hypothetical protein